MSKISYFSFFISSSTLVFQVYVLNPWNLHISKQVNRLENKIDKLVIRK
jgi:hypothetical protein